MSDNYCAGSFHRDLGLKCLKRRRDHKLTESKRHREFRTVTGKYSASGVSFVWFTDKKIFTVAPPNNLQTRKSNSSSMPPPVQRWFGSSIRYSTGWNGGITCWNHRYTSAGLIHRDLELWPFDPKMYCIHLCPILHHWCKFGENPTNTFQDIVLRRHRANKPEKCCFQHTLFHLDLDLWPFDPKLWSVHVCPIAHHCCKFGDNVSNTLQDTLLTMFRDARTDK